VRREAPRWPEAEDVSPDVWCDGQEALDRLRPAQISRIVELRDDLAEGQAPMPEAERKAKAQELALLEALAPVGTQGQGTGAQTGGQTGQTMAQPAGVTENAQVVEPKGAPEGAAGRWISIVAMALCGVIYIFNKDDLTGGFKLLLGVVFGISFTAFAASIVDNIFSFSGQWSDRGCLRWPGRGAAPPWTLPAGGDHLLQPP